MSDTAPCSKFSRICGSVKSWSAPIVLRKTSMTMAGRTIGSLIRRMIFHSGVSSRMAASTTSRGTDLSAVYRMIML